MGEMRAIQTLGSEFGTHEKEATASIGHPSAGKKAETQGSTGSLVRVSRPGGELGPVRQIPCLNNVWSDRASAGQVAGGTERVNCHGALELLPVLVVNVT